jgi:hypothetical protein
MAHLAPGALRSGVSRRGQERQWPSGWLRSNRRASDWRNGAFGESGSITRSYVRVEGLIRTAGLRPF